MRPFNIGLRWRILEMANEVDRRRERQIRCRFLANINPLTDISDTEFIKTFRLSKEAVKDLVEELSLLMKTQQRNDGISVLMKVLIALSFYGTGSYQTLVGQSAMLNVSQTSVSRAVRQVTDALNHPNIFKKYVKWPLERKERSIIKARFYDKYKIPCVLGCIDCTHVAILRPTLNEERYFNRKGYHSLNVMIICDSDLNILCVDASTPGSAHDCDVWQSHPLSQHLAEINNNGEQVFLLGDNAYPLRRTMITPILNTVEGTPEHYYDNLLVTARSSIERCIGLLKARFRCLLVARILHYGPVRAGQIVNACSVLHNIANRSSTAVPPLSPEELDAENLRQIQELVVNVASVLNDAHSLHVNRDLQEGQALQQTLVDKLWRDRNSTD